MTKLEHFNIFFVTMIAQGNFCICTCMLEETIAIARKKVDKRRIAKGPIPSTIAICDTFASGDI